MKENAKWFALGGFVIVLIAVGIIINNFVGIKGKDSDILDAYNGDINTNWDVYEVKEVALSESYTISEAGVYSFFGSLVDGGITINTDDRSAVKIILNGVSITNHSGPAISCLEADDLLIEFKGENYLTDGSAYSSSLDEDVEGVIYSKADLSLDGDGTVSIISNYKDAIVGKDDLTIRGGTYNITAVDDAIRGKDSVYITGGTLNLIAAEDGIKSTNNTLASKGFVYITGGTLNISAGDDGIHAENFLIVDDGEINIIKSYEGLEGVKITLNGGNINVKASDDGINAGGGTSESNTPRPGGMMDADEDCVLTINNSNIYVNANGDGIDSNGYVYINGGSVVVDGPTNNGNGALDAGLGFVINGGEAFAVGSSGMAENFGGKSSINNISVYLSNTAKAGTVVEIKDIDGNVILSHTSAKSFSHIAAASSKFIAGGAYIIYIDGAEYTGFTINDVTTVIGNRVNDGMPAGGMPGGPDRH